MEEVISNEKKVEDVVLVDKSVELECVMNSLCVFSEMESYLSFRCSICPQIGENICKLCFERCHKNHNTGIKSLSEKTVGIKAVPCSCAVKGHVVTKKESDLNEICQENRTLQCTLNEVLHLSNIEFYYMDPTTHMYYCIYCLDICLKEKEKMTEGQLLSKYIKKERIKFAQGAPLCSCSDKDAHSSMSDNMNCLVGLITSSQFESYLNRIQIPGQMLSKTVLIENYLKKFREVNKEIYEAYKDGNFDETFNRNQISKEYLSCMELLRSFAVVYGQDNSFVTNLTISGYYNFDFLDTIFPKSRRRPSDDGIIIETKANCLYYFRKFFLFPAIKKKRWTDPFTDFENVNPLHRLLFKLNIKEFISLIGVEKGTFFRFFHRVYLAIFAYNDKVDEHSYQKLIIEFFKWLIMFASLRYTDHEDITQIYYENIKKFVSITEMLHNKKSYENTIKKYIEIFVVKIMLNTNDEIFFREIFRIEGAVQNTVPNTSTDSSSRIYFRRNTYIQLQEEEEENENFSKLHPEVADSHEKAFCFENGEMQLKLIKSLFPFKKDAADASKEINRWEIFDILISKNDFYLEGLKSYCESKQKKLFDSSIRDLFHSLSAADIAKYFTNEGIATNLQSDLNQFEDLRKRYYDARINENTLYETMMQLLRSSKKTIIRSLPPINENAKGKNDNDFQIKQIILFKIGYFDTIVNFWYLYNSSNYLKSYLGAERFEQFAQEIFELFTILTHNNTLLISIFFHPQIIELFFGKITDENPSEESKDQENSKQESEKTQEDTGQLRILKQEFYLYLIKTSAKLKYHLNLIKFVNVLRGQFLILQRSINNNVENILTKNLREINIIFKILNKCLKISTQKSSMKINAQVATLIKDILCSQLFRTVFTNYKKCFKDESMNKLITPPEEKQFIILVYKIISNLNDSYFSLISELINITEICQILEENQNEMDPFNRRILTMIYSKYYAEAPFHIIKEITNKHLKIMNEEIDINVLGRFTMTEEDNMELNAKLAEASKTQRGKTPKSTLMNVFKKPAAAIEVKNVKEAKDVKNEDPLYGLAPLYNNLEKYRRHMKIFLNTYFKNNPKMFIKYFTNVILFPSLFCVYKILYFPPRLSAKYKYLAYKMIYLFLECYKYFLYIFSVDSLKFLNNDEVRHILTKYFEFERPGQDLMEFIRNVIEDLNTDIYRMSHDTRFEPMKLKGLMEMFVKYARRIKCLYFLPKEKKEEVCITAVKQIVIITKKPEEEVVKVKNDIIDKLRNFLENYQAKKADIEGNVLISLFKSSEDADIRIGEVKTSIALDLIARLDYDNVNTDNPLTICKEDNIALFEVVTKIFKADPDLWHNLLIKTISVSKKILYAIIRTQLTFLFQFIFIDFHKLCKDLPEEGEPQAIERFLSIIEFLRLLCENHHKIFQTLLVNIYITFGELDLVDFILKLPVLALNNISYFKSKKDIVVYFKKTNTKYFNNFLIKITDYLIEIIQGSFANNMLKIANSADFQSYYESGYRCFDIVDSEEYEFFLSQFFRFLNCYLEENTNSSEKKGVIIKRFNPIKMLQGLMHSTKKLYLTSLGKDQEEGEEKVPLAENFSEKLTQMFLTNPEMVQDYHFALACGIFKYFKSATLWKCGARVQKLLDHLKTLSELSELPKVDKNRNQIILKREAYKFFNTIVKEVEVFYKLKENIEEIELNKFRDFFEDEFFDFEKIRDLIHIELQGIQKVVYLIHSDSLFINDSDQVKFLANSPYDNFNTKLSYILNYLPDLIEDVSMRKVIWGWNSKIANFLYLLNYQTAMYLSITMAVIVNIIVCFSSVYEKVIPEEAYYPTYTQNQLMPVGKALPEIIVRSEKNSGVIFYFSLVHLILLFLLITNWLTFTIYRVRKFKTNVENKIAHVFLLLFGNEIYPLIWNFLTGLIAIISIEFHFLYSLQLFAVFNIFETMQTVIYSIKIRYKQFLSAALLIAIFSLFYASIKFYWFKENIAAEENTCDTFSHCFLSLITSGIRGGNGLGFAQKPIREEKYFSEFIFEWVFYFSIMLILLNVINGIIVDTFQALREQNNLKFNVKENVCYICSINRSKFERKGIDFKTHKNIEHNVMNYFHYILMVKLTDEQELNSLNYQVLNSLKKIKTDFFPVKKALSLGNEGK